MANKVKGRKMDPYTVSNQKWEIAYVAHLYSTKPSIVREIKKQVGKSRRKIYASLRKKLFGK